MGTFQPLYYSGGRYTSSADRKLLSALIDAESDGKRIAGVIAAGTETGSMAVTATSPNTVSVAPGMCVIPDSTTPTISSGLYLAGVSGSAETAYFPTNGTGQKTHTVYAVVDDTPYTISSKCIVSNVVTLTTTAAHGFAVDQTIKPFY